MSVRIANVHDAAGSIDFIDRQGNPQKLQYEIAQDADSEFLTICTAECNEVCTFKPWTSYPDHWCCSGIVVANESVGFGSAMFKAAQQLLGARGKKLAPSDVLKDDGVKMWARYDPSISIEEMVSQGCFRPDLKGRLPPK